ncbi:MAG: OadG family protein [Lachnospiraceae bacterium]|nr:OadG family protein [Lachnospiraceae bacterium]
MKKRLLALVCMITCIFGLTACGSEEALTTFEQKKVDNAELMAKQAIIPILTDYLCVEDTFAQILPDTELSELTMEEIAHVCEQTFGIEVDGYAVLTAVESFDTALDTIGGIAEIGDATAKIDDDQIVVEVEVKGEKKNAKAEIIFSNDMFMRLESASLNPVSTTGELMGKAALNTLIGMGTVFVVLILISLIISLFGFIPKLQAASAKRKERKKAEKATGEKTGIDNAVAQITAQEEVADAADDLELAAVIAAAIAAYEGSASTDGFVVRSIRRRV